MPADVDGSFDEMFNTYHGKRALITGGLGFIGSNLARRLLRLGAEVTIVDSLIPEFGGNLRNVADIKSRVVVNISDIRDRYSLPVFLRGQHFLFNLAGQTSHMDSMSDPETDLEINTRAQLSLLEACRRHNPEVRIVFSSTRQIYGRPDYLPVDENHPLRPVDVNGINKRAGEEYHLLYHKVYGIRSSILRLTNTVGPGMRIKDARQTFVGIWIRRALEHQPFEVWGGNQLRDFTFVDDAVDAFLLAGQCESAAGRVFNLGGCEQISLRNLAELLATAVGGARYDIREFPPERMSIDIGDFYANYQEIERVLGWKPAVRVQQALEMTVRYYQQELANYI